MGQGWSGKAKVPKNTWGLLRECAPGLFCFLPSASGQDPYAGLSKPHVSSNHCEERCQAEIPPLRACAPVAL